MIERLFASDEASILTNEAARMLDEMMNEIIELGVQIDLLVEDETWGQIHRGGR